MSMAALIRKMADAGATPEAIALAVEAIEAEREKDATRRAKRAEQKRQERDRKATVARQSGDMGRDTPPKKEKSPTPPKEKTTPGSEAKASSQGARDFFAEFWLAYPRREGPNPKKPARDRFHRLVAKGHDPEALVAAAKALAAEHPTPTRFVPQAITWLNQERFDEAEPVLSGDEFCPDDWPNTRFLVLRYRQERQTDPPRSVQGGKAGFLLPAEWVARSKQQQVANA